MGHTEAVAMAHYRQSTGKAAEKFFEQATRGNAVAESVAEHAGIECFGVEAEKMGFAISPCISTACNESRRNAKGAKMPQMTPTGLEPVSQP